MIVKLLYEHHLDVLSLKGGCTGLSESTHVKMPNCWKSHATAQIMQKQPKSHLQAEKENDLPRCKISPLEDK